MPSPTAAAVHAAMLDAGWLAFRDHSPWINGLIFAAAAAAVWFAGTRLARHADVLADRTGLGRVFIGLFLLAAVTSLPELATTVTAARIGNAGLAVSNLLGGVAMQTAILAAADLVLVRGALTFFAPSPILLTQGVILIGMLALAMMGVGVGPDVAVAGVGLWPTLLALGFVLMLWTSYAPSARPRWRAEPNPDQPEGPEVQRQTSAAYERVATARLVLYVCANGLLILAAGFIVAKTGDALSVQTGLGSTLVGAMVVAIATSLPEISTTTQAIRLGAYSMAISNIFGSNAFCLALLLVADVCYTGGPIMGEAPEPTLFLAGLGVVMSCVYLWGLLERRNRTVLRMGVDSAAVMVLYVAGLAVLYVLR